MEVRNLTSFPMTPLSPGRPSGPGAPCGVKYIVIKDEYTSTKYDFGLIAD